ncbi:NAD(P)H-quinone oxidoreductase [Chitinimonas sp.]|uniref:NAD(P)H-quinone oxidoreductase n=1 Tax=Chitinimonas sp. TaxID=1934313 RepID=UPI0035B2B1DB
MQTAPGGADTLVLGEMDCPQPGPGQLLVKVAAAGVNRADIVQREGRYPAPAGASPILGLEVAGTVAALGDGVSGFAPGDAVFGLVAGGGYAEYALLDAGCAIARPTWLSAQAAASLPEAWMTAWFNLIEQAQLQAGETVLIHAGASGVGAAAIQLARWHGATVLATAGSDDKLAFCRRLGADQVFNYRSGDFADWAKAAGGVDVVLDCVGGNYLASNIASLKPDGRLVLIGLMGGASASIDLSRLLMKRLALKGSTLRPQPLAVKSRLTAALAGQILPALCDGRLQLTLDRSFAWQQVAASHCYLESNANLGKVVLDFGEGNQS